MRLSSIITECLENLRSERGQSEGKNDPEEHSDPVDEFARVSRIIISVEQIYDVADNISSKPRDIVNALGKLSRLQPKVLNDIERLMEKKNCNTEKERSQDSGEVSKHDSKQYNECNMLRNAKNLLLKYPNLLRNFLFYLRCLQEKDSRGELFFNEARRFAILSIATDWYSYEIRRLLWGE